MELVRSAAKKRFQEATMWLTFFSMRSGWVAKPPKPCKTLAACSINTPLRRPALSQCGTPHLARASCGPPCHSQDSAFTPAKQKPSQLAIPVISQAQESQVKNRSAEPRPIFCRNQQFVEGVNPEFCGSANTPATVEPLMREVLSK